MPRIRSSRLGALVVTALALLLAATVTVTATARPQDVRPPPEVDSSPSHGKTCLVCGHRIDRLGSLRRHRGRRVHLHAGECTDHWSLSDEARETYFARLQPRSALFDENALLESKPSWGWLAVGLYVLAGLVFGAGSAYAAVSRNRGPVRWFVAGLLANLLALAVILTLPRCVARDLPQGVPRGLTKVPRTREPALCPHCGRGNHPAARTCSDCGADLQPAVQSEARRVRPAGAGEAGS